MIVLMSCVSEWSQDYCFREIETLEEVVSQISEIPSYTIAHKFFNLYKENRGERFKEEGFLKSFLDVLNSYDLNKTTILVIVKYYAEFKYIKENYETFTVKFRYSDNIKKRFFKPS